MRVPYDNLILGGTESHKAGDRTGKFENRMKGRRGGCFRTECSFGGLGLHGPLHLNGDQIADNASPVTQITLAIGRIQLPVT